MTHPTCMTKSLEADTGEIAVPTWTLTILLKTVAEHMRGRPAADDIAGYIFGMLPTYCWRAAGTCLEEKESTPTAAIRWPSLSIRSFPSTGHQGLLPEDLDRVTLD